MNIRVASGAVDPLSGNEDLVEKAKNILTNTVEQTVFNFVNQLVLVSWIPQEQMFIVPLLAILFVVGRVSFMIGYTIKPRYRTFGFILTFFPSFFMFISNLMFGLGFQSKLLVFSANSPASPPRSSN